MSLRNDLIRLAHEKPEFRSEILPLIKEAKAFSSQAQLDEYIDSLETDAGKERARKTHTVEEKGDAPMEDKGVLGSIWQAIKDLASALVGKKKEADSAKKDNTAMKKKLMDQVGWGDMNPDDVEFVMIDGDFGCQPCDAKGKDGFKKMDVSDADAKKAMASQNKEKKAVADLEKTQKEHDKKKAEAEKAEKKQKSKGKKPRENGELPIGDRGQKKKKREDMTKAEMIKEYQEAIKKSDMSPEDKKKAIEQSKKPNFDPEAALGAMGDDDEDDGGKTATTLRNKVIRLAYDKPELRKKLLPLLKQAKLYDEEGRRIYDFTRDSVEWEKHAKDIVRELRRADGPWGSVRLGKKGRHGRVIYFVPDYSHLQEGRGSKAKWIPGTTYADINDTEWQCDREMPAATRTVLERMGYESRYSGRVYVHEDDAIWIDFDQSDNLAKGNCYITVTPMPGIGIYKNANTMPSSNRRSIVGPKSGKHRKE